MNKNDFKIRIDKELEGLTFSPEAAKKVREAVKKPGSGLSLFLNREIRIPVQPFAAALLIAATLIVYVFAGELRVSTEDVQKSRITVIDNNNGRQGNDIYKD